MKKTKVIKTKVGKLTLVANQKGIESIGFSDRDVPEVTVSLTPEVSKKIDLHLKKAEQQLAQYFEGKRKDFDLEISPVRGTPFQKRVWKALCGIPFGQTWSYSDIANKVGSPKAVRAVGMANKRNPIAIVVPCHRVIGKNGALVGYDGGLNNKTKLLKLEGSLK